jgi:hypothetical protein
VILMAVRWYLRHPLSATSVMELLAERGIDVSNRTVLRWVQAFGRCWYTDEMFFFRGNDKWYLYRAIDERGQVVDVLLRSTATPPPLKRSSSRRCAVLARYRVRSSPTTISRTSRRSSGPYQPPCTFEVDSIA